MSDDSLEGRRGRPSELTEGSMKSFLDAIAIGVTREAAAAAIGVSSGTVRRWLRRARKEPRADTLYARFRQGLIQAEGQAQQRYIACIAKAAPRDWRAAAFMAERRWPEAFGRREAVEHSGPKGGPIESSVTTKLDLSKLSTEELLTIRALQEKARRKP